MFSSSSNLHFKRKPGRIATQPTEVFKVLHYLMSELSSAPFKTEVLIPILSIFHVDSVRLPLEWNHTFESIGSNWYQTWIQWVWNLLEVLQLHHSISVLIRTIQPPPYSEKYYYIFLVDFFNFKPSLINATSEILENLEATKIYE